MSDTIRQSPLVDAHRALGGRLVPFGGWEMPLQYSSVLEEHRACRSAAVVFDVSHLGSVTVQGPGSFAVLQLVLSNDLRKIEPGRAQYSHALDPDDAAVLDDVIVWWRDRDDFVVLPNAANTEPFHRTLAAGVADVEEACAIEDLTAARALLAVQGPTARDRLEAVVPEAAGVGRFRVETVAWHGTPLVVAGTGYTGEEGVEIHVAAGRARELWDAVLDAGVTPAGLGARDTLRLEMGYPLHGHELGPGITPLQAGLGWVIGWDKERFFGRDALVAERESGPSRRLRGVRFGGRRFPRAGYPVSADGTPVGEVTSGNFSPTLERGIALALLDPRVEPGDEVAADIRGRPEAGTVVTPPFVEH